MFDLSHSANIGNAAVFVMRVKLLLPSFKCIDVAAVSWVFSVFQLHVHIFLLIVSLVERLTFSVVIFTTQMRNLSAAFVISKLVTAQFFIPILLLNHLIQPVMHFI